MAGKLQGSMERAWNRAAKASDIATLAALRACYEAEGLGLVAVKLTQTSLDRLSGSDGYIYAPSVILPGGLALWVHYEDAEQAADWFRDNIEEEQDRAMGDCFKDLTPSQERFLGRQVAKSMRRAERDLRATVRRAEAIFAAPC